MKAPFTYFGGKAAVAKIIWRALGQPDHYFLFFVLHLIFRRVVIKAANAFAENSGLWMAKCCALLIRARFEIVSFNGLPSIWCTPKPIGILPYFCSHKYLEYNFHWFPFPVFIYLLFVILPYLFLVLIVVSPIKYLSFCPYPFSVFITHLFYLGYYYGDI